MHSCYFDTLPDEMNLSILENLEPINLMDILIAFPDTRIANVLCFDEILINKLPPIDKKKIDVMLSKYRNSELFMKWINLPSVNKKIFSCFYDLLPDEIVLSILGESRSLNDLANLIIDYPNSRVANVLCFNDQLIKKNRIIHILDIHRLVNSHHRNSLLMKWINLPSLKKNIEYLTAFDEKYYYKFTSYEEYVRFNSVFDRDGDIYEEGEEPDFDNIPEYAVNLVGNRFHVNFNRIFELFDDYGQHHKGRIW